MANDNDTKYNEYINVKLINGKRMYIIRKHVIGYCHCDKHKGHITKTLLKSHECLSKQCRYFEKFSDHPYWEIRDIELNEKERKKELRKKTIKEEHEKHDRWIREAQSIADALGYPMKIINIRKTPGKKHFIIFYISDKPKNDWFRFLDLAKEFGGCRYAIAELRHIKDMDGNYVTF